MITVRPPCFAWLLLPLALACGGDASTDDVERWRIAHRFIVDEPVETFERSRLYQRVNGFTWRFDSATDMAPWMVRPEGAAYPGPGGVTLRGRRPVPALIRQVDFDANEIEVVEVDVVGLQQGPLRWFWRRQGEQFIGDRGLRVVGSLDVGDQTVTHRLAVADHDLWSGRIRRLRLDPTMTEDEMVRVVEVRGIRYAASPEMLEAWVHQSWKVDLDHELRSALLAPPGTPIERLIQIPARTRLRFAYGVRGRLGVPMTFRVVAIDSQAPDGSDLGKTLFTEQLDPAVDDMTIWREASVSLDELAGTEVRLRLEASPTGDWDPSSGMPVFANPEVLALGPAPDRPNVVLISIDTLRADHLSLYGYGRRTSPHLDAWAARSAVMFENAVVSAPWTLPSHASMLSGLDADRHGGVNYGVPVPPDIKTLPEYLRGAGYRTLAITGGGWMRPEYGFARGVDRYRYWPPGVDKQPELELGVERAGEWLASMSEDPFFLFFHTFEVHSPHRRRQPFFAALTGSSDPDADSIITEKSSTSPEDGFLVHKSFFWHRKNARPQLTPIAEDEIHEVVDRYDSAIAFTDHEIGRLLKSIEELGLDRNTVVVITSDHGDAFGEKGLASHGYLYDFNLLVPLIIALPGGAGGGRKVEEQVRSVDIVPTVLEILGLPAPPDIDGTSLLGLLEGQTRGASREAWSYAGSSNRGISVRLSNRRKYIFNNTPWPPLQGSEELYDLDVDPSEEHDLIGTDQRFREIRQRAVRRLVERIQGVVVHARNDGVAPVHGVLRGGAIRDFRLKALAPEGAPLRWTDTEPGVARFTIPPGAFGAYVIEGAGTEDLEIEVEVERGSARRFVVDTTSLDRPWQVRYADSAWLSGQASEAAPIAITVSRRGSGRATVADPAAMDPQLRLSCKRSGT